MPATRRARTSGGPATKGAQSTLSFCGRNRVTKAVPPASKLSKDNTESLKAEAITIEPEAQKAEPDHVFSEAAVQKQAEIELIKPKTEAELLAEKVTDAQIKKYWRAREAERTTPRGMVASHRVTNQGMMD
jgi:DNA polymerase delta subunit 4